MTSNDLQANALLTRTVTVQRALPLAVLFWALLERAFLSAFTSAVEWVSFRWLMVFTMALIKVLFSGQ